MVRSIVHRSAGTTRLRVLIAEDNVLIRNILRKIIQPHFDIVTEADNGHDAVALAEGLRPEIVLLDISMPRICGLDAARMIKERLPEARILILSNYSDTWHIDEAFRMGADGYVLKGSTLFQLPETIKDACAGRKPRPA